MSKKAFSHREHEYVTQVRLEVAREVKQFVDDTLPGVCRARHHSETAVREMPEQTSDADYVEAKQTDSAHFADLTALYEAESRYGTLIGMLTQATAMNKLKKRKLTS